MNSVSAVGAVGALLVLASVVRLVVAGRMRFRYAGMWLVVSAAVAVLALVPGLLRATAGALGFVVPANLLFFAGVVLLLLVGVHLSVAVTTLEDRVQRLAEELVLLTDEVRESPVGREVRESPVGREVREAKVGREVREAKVGREVREQPQRSSRLSR
jgi:hypothetical protein